MEKSFRLKVSYLFMLMLSSAIVMYLTRYWTEIQTKVGNGRDIFWNDLFLPQAKSISANYMDIGILHNKIVEKTLATTTWKHNCSHGINAKKPSEYEDILCMKPPKFLKKYKNPCWYEEKQNITKFYCLPYFNLFGSAKCATTDLYHRIVQHPQILRLLFASRKETAYWSLERYGECDGQLCSNPKQRFTRFLRNFPSNGILKGTSSNRPSNYNTLITGLSDPRDIYTLYHWKHIPQNDPSQDEPLYTTPHLVRHMTPSIKLILILREPAERLYSDFLYRKLGRTKWDFHTNVMKFVPMMKQCIASHTARVCVMNETLEYKLKTFPLFASMYSVLLKEWMSVFPRKQFLILRTEDYKRDIPGTLQRIYTFLGVEPMSRERMESTTKLGHQNENKIHTLAGEMLQETKVFLNDFFARYVTELAVMLNDEKFLWK